MVATLLCNLDSLFCGGVSSRGTALVQSRTLDEKKDSSAKERLLAQPLWMVPARHWRECARYWDQHEIP